MIGTEHMKNNTMFTVSRDFRGYRSNEFNELNRIVKSLRNDNRAAILKFVSHNDYISSLILVF